MIMKIIKLLKNRLSTLNEMYETNILLLVKCLFLSLGIIFFINEYYELRSPFLFIISVSILFHIVLVVMKENKSNMMIYFIITIVIASLIFGGLLFRIPYKEFIYNAYHWCRKYNGDDELFRRDYSLFTTFILMLVINISVYFLHKIKMVKYIISFALPIGLIILTIYGINISKVTIICVFLYVLPVLASLLGKPLKNESNGHGDSQTTIYLIPVYCIMIVIATVIPSSKEPINWSIIKQIASDISEKGAYIRNKLEYFSDRKGKEFAFSTGGYKEKDDNELGGLLEYNKNISLLVTTSNKSISNGYLIGSVYDIYTGRGFRKSNEIKKAKEKDSYNNYRELINTLAIEDEKGIDLSEIILKRDYDITYKDIRTRTLFYPSWMIEINLPRKTKYEETILGSMILHKAKGVGYSYDLTYYELNLESEVLKDVFRNAEKVDKVASAEAINKILKQYFNNNSTKESELYHLYEETVNRNDKIYESYTKLPNTITDRTKKLAYELTKDFHNDYDKLKSIESFLNSYEYTTKVSDVRDNVDFVDNFLFVEKKGYCTYYAASMVVLARCVNIPMKYIEGFIIDYKEVEKKDTYKVFNSNAHAWVEGYIKEIGWIPFEPTSGFYESRYSGWIDYSKVDDSYLGDWLTESTNNRQIDYDMLVNNIEGKHLEQTNTMKNIYNIVKVLLLLILIIVLTIIFVLTYYYLLEKKYKKKYISSNQGEKVMILVNELLRLFDLDGYKRIESETLLQFCNSIEHKPIKDISFLDVVQVYMKVRYGEEVIVSEELELVTTFIQKYKILLIPKVGKLKMFLFKFFYLISIND